MYQFAKIEQRYFSVELRDGTELNLTTPTKAGLNLIAEYYECLQKGIGDTGNIKRLYEIFAAFLSRNKEGKTIEPKSLYDDYSLKDDILDFIEQYIKFVTGEIENPN